MRIRHLATAIALTTPTEAAATCLGQTATIVGTAGPDDLVGTPLRDVVSLGGGDDSFIGLGGNDLVCAGAGDDTIGGDGGNDVLDGGPGRDKISGGAGNDVVRGDGGADTIGGSSGNDRGRRRRRARLCLRGGRRRPDSRRWRP